MTCKYTRHKATSGAAAAAAAAATAAATEREKERRTLEGTSTIAKRGTEQRWAIDRGYVHMWRLEWRERTTFLLFSHLVSGITTTRPRRFAVARAKTKGVETRTPQRPPPPCMDALNNEFNYKSRSSPPPLPPPPVSSLPSSARQRQSCIENLIGSGDRRRSRMIYDGGIKNEKTDEWRTEKEGPVRSRMNPPIEISKCSYNHTLHRHRGKSSRFPTRGRKSKLITL